MVTRCKRLGLLQAAHDDERTASSMTEPAPVPIPSTFERAAAAGRSNSVMAPFLLLTGLGAIVVVARSLSAPEFAFYAAVIALRSLMGYVGDLGTGAAAGRTFAQLQQRGAGHQARHLFTRLFLLRIPLVAAVVMVLVAFPETVSSTLNLKPNERGLLPLLAAIAAIELLGTLGSYALSGTFHHADLNRVSLAAGILQPLAVMAAGLLSLGLSGIVAAVLLGSLVRNGGFLLLGLRAIRTIERTGRPVVGLAGTYIRVAGSAAIGKLAAVLHQRQALTFVGLSAFGRVELAAFALAYDFAQQALTAAAAPILSLVTPSLSAVSGDRSVTEQAYRFVTRLLSVAVLPLGFALAAVMPTLIPTVFGASFVHADLYGAIFLPAFAVEIVLLGPTTALMLADDELLPTFRRIKFWTIASAVLYLPAIAWSLPAAAVLMMMVRVLSGACAHLVVHRRTGMSAFGSWLRPVMATTAAAAVTAGLLASLLPETLPSLAGALLSAFVVAVLVARFSGLVQARDLELAERAMPVMVRPLKLMRRSPGLP